MRKITKFRHSAKAISPIISALLLIAIAVVASLIAYAWIMGYIGGSTNKSGNSIQIVSVSYTSSGNLTIYVQNTGQGIVHLKQDGSVYVNDVLKLITQSPAGTNVNSGALIPIDVGKTVQIVINCYYHIGDRIKVVTVEGTSAETTGNGSSAASTLPPVASFTFSPASPTVNQNIAFQDASITGNGISQWSWSFGDGATSTTQNPTHAYTSTGSKTVTLTVTDLNGKTSTVSKSLTVTGLGSPTADFTFTPTSPSVGATVTFTDQSKAGSAAINHWSWNFGDGQTSIIQSPTHAFSTSGQYSVSLTVTDANSKTSTATKTVNVGVVAPTAQFTMSTSNPNMGQTVSFTDTSAAASGTSLSQWSWNFGDGATSTTRNPTHAYTSMGQKTVTLTVTDNNGKTGGASQTLTVLDYASPVAGFSYSPIAPNPGDTITFTDTSTSGSGTISQWSWNFGDGATSTTQSPTHAYSTANQYSISLTVTDSNSKTGTVTQTILVGSAPQPTPTGSGNPQPTPTSSANPTPTPTPTPTPAPGSTVQVTFTVDPANSGTTSPSGTHTYNYGDTVAIQATPDSGYAFSTWTKDSSSSIPIANDQSASTTATMLSSGTLTAHFISSTSNKLAFTAGTSQGLGINVPSSVITVQRQTSAGSIITGSTTTVILTTTSSGGKFYSNAACTTQITQLTIGTSGSTNFYYMDSITGAPTITVSATNFASDSTTFSINLRYSNFDGTNWISGWSTGTQPPWYEGVGEGIGGTNCAKSDSTNYLGGNDGPFTCDVVDTSADNTITITFMYKVQNTDSASDLRIAWSSATNPDFGPNSGDFHYFASIGTPVNTGWNSYTITFTKAQAPSMFTTHLWFRFESNLQTHQGSGLVETVWVDNVIISGT